LIPLSILKRALISSESARSSSLDIAAFSGRRPSEETNVLGQAAAFSVGCANLLLFQFLLNGIVSKNCNEHLHVLSHKSLICNESKILRRGISHAILENHQFDVGGPASGGNQKIPNKGDIAMKARILVLGMMFLAAAAMGSEKGEKMEAVRVFVFDATTKPAAAINTGRYETRTVSKDDPSMMCKNCNHSRPVGSEKPAQLAGKRSEAFLCTHCHDVVWLDGGKEIEITDKRDEDALKVIKKELKKKDTTTKPAAIINTEK
jgi:hypothetical protein